MSKSSFLVLGGCGFIGRNVVLHLIKSGKASQIIVADKSRPELAWLNVEHSSAFSNPLVFFRQCNLSVKSSVESLFSSYDIDYVINCCLESRLGNEAEVYKESIVTVGSLCATAAAAKGVKRFIQVSTGAIYSSKKCIANEDSSENPKTLQAVAHRELDLELAKIPNLQYIIVRPAIVYGKGDFYMLTPRFVIASVYRLMNEKMKLLYSKDLRLNTVHVDDVARALIFLCENGTCGRKYIACDKSNTTLGSLNDMLANIFKIKYDFVSSAECALAKTMLKKVAHELNERHLTPWSICCAEENIQSTPLSPYLDKEALKHGAVSLDGSFIESLGFTYERPSLTEDNIIEIIEDFVENKLFPMKGYPRN